MDNQSLLIRSTARDRRCQRRVDARNDSETANLKNTPEKDEDIKEINADTEKVEAYKETVAAVKITDGIVVEKTAEDAETTVTKVGSIECEECDMKFDLGRSLSAHKVSIQ